MILEHDWGATALGPQADWSPTLRTAVSSALNSRFPFLLMWGPELVMVYNDAYAPMLGARHPAALGHSAREVWSDIWAALDPMVEEVMAGRATYSEDLPLVMTRNGWEEETYFSFSFSPVVEPGGRVVGLLDTVVETTHRVLAARRLGLLQRLGSLPRAAHGDTTEAVSTALGILAEARSDCPFGIVYLTGDAGEPRLAAAQGVGVQGYLAGESVPDPVLRAMATGEIQTVTGLADRFPGLASVGASPVGQADVDTAVVLPLTAAGALQPVGALVLGVSPHLPLDDDYRIFLSLAAGQVAATVTDAQAVATERRRAEERAESERARAQFFTDVAVTLQRAVLGPTVLPAGFAVHYEPATGTLEVGGDWYDVVDLPDGGYGVVVGDVVGRGLPAAAVMGQLRSAGRALLLESRSPAHVLSALDRFAALVPGAAVSTVFCAVIDPRTGSIRYSSAGHPPALLVHADGTVRQLEGGSAVPLAVVEGGKRPEGELHMPPGSTLLLYTDGLIERRDEALDEGITRAAEALAEGRDLGPAQLGALLTERLLADAPDDDVAFVLFRC
ncbi:SpoIIE family protein phosphatase [Blastococcus sp. LR1]|uniref:SpoIIE family protein phosphatase n=1 Tax=Blastococcus sp. LR1 TaxID=2877000 RepID=UPI001CCC9D27|nr:SpoIIE family protein phosphatase [Blastococcus sp. LR1]MCA0146954.1 SpoIIE family protein phosphatase [Blastococcus sp. LR1]